MAKQVLDIRSSKGMTKAESNEHLRCRTKASLENALRVGNYDPTREHLNFEVTRGGIIIPIDKQHSIPDRMVRNLMSRQIHDPNEGAEKRKMRTIVNIILGGSRDQMRRLAFGNQIVNDEKGADNSSLQRKEDIEKWAKDMYQFMAKKYGEENILAFVVHLDELNPHVHCTMMPITEEGKFNYKKIFHGENKFTLSAYYHKLHDELSIINSRYDLKRGSCVMETGARHRSTEEYLRMLDDERTELESRCSKLQAEIIAYRNTKKSLEDEISKAERRVKGLTSMVTNLENDRKSIENQIAVLKSSSDTMSREKEARLFVLEQQLKGIEEKIEDKQNKLNVAEEQLHELGSQNQQLQDEYDRLKSQVDDVMPMAERNAHQNIGELLSEMMIEDTKVQFSYLSKIDLKALDYFEGTMLMDVAEHGNSIVSVASALFMGYTDQATEFAQTHGGGGGPGTGWGRRDGEDDRRWARRCLMEAAKMMRGHKRGLKR